MNCLEFRRRLLEDPYDTDIALAQHEDHCDQCAPYARQIRAQETQLRAMLNDISPPPELAENIRLEASFEQQGRSRRQVWYAAAASVLLIIGATTASLVTETWERGNMALAQSVLNHIDDEAHHLRSAGPTAPQRVANVFERFGATVTGNLGQVNFAAECLMRKSNGVHLVVPGKLGPVTVFYIPGEYSDTVININSSRFHGVITPTSWGSVAVVGEQGETLDAMARQMANAVQWATI